ncbi:MAG: histone deacetylase family protein [Betaproteobacteria bacterium]
MPTAFISHRDCTLHDMGRDHPESPERLHAIRSELITSGLIGHLVEYEAPLAQREQLLRVHDAEYLDAIEAAAPAVGTVHLDPDTVMNPHSYTAALRAAGAAVLATDLVIAGTASTAFCSVRPPGHHAERTHAMGFCIFNNVAVAAAHALDVYGIERVAIADFDVHHGNGTEDIFRDDPRVMMVSTFQHPFYPYSGVEGRSERMVNLPLRAHSDGQVFRNTVEAHWLPALHDFRPQVLFISAGFDAHRDDELATLALTDADYIWVTEQLRNVAAQHAEGRIISTLEGGYHLAALGRCVAAHIKCLAGV